MLKQIFKTFKMFLRKIVEINFNDSLNKHYGTVLDNIKHVFILFKKRNKVILNNTLNIKVFITSFFTRLNHPCYSYKQEKVAF